MMNNKSISNEKIFSIIHKPLTTEKSTNLQQYNQYTFIVSKNSTSSDIKQAIESIFKVKVLKINTSILRGKVKSFKVCNMIPKSHNLIFLVGPKLGGGGCENPGSRRSQTPV